MSEDRWPFHIYDEDFLAFREWLKEHDNQMREEGARVERKRLLDDVMGELSGCNDIEDAKNAIRTMRSEVGK